MDRSAPETLSGQKVLICDSEPIVGLSFSKVLRGAGMIVTGTAQTGKSAINLAHQFRPDVVLLDVEIGAGWAEGIATTRKILRILPDAIIIGISAPSDEQAIKEAICAGMNAYIPKPVGGEDLVSLILCVLKLFPRRTRRSCRNRNRSVQNRVREHSC